MVKHKKFQFTENNKGRSMLNWHYEEKHQTGLPKGVAGPGEAVLEDEALVAMEEDGVRVRGVLGLANTIFRSCVCTPSSFAILSMLKLSKDSPFSVKK